MRGIRLWPAFLVVLGAWACGDGRSPSSSPSSWNPGSSDLVFMSNRDGNAEVYLVPAGSSEWINLTDDPGGDNWPEWSPDGTRIAFQTSRSGKLDIWVMDADGSHPVRLTDHPDHDYLPAWSPDGTRLTFASWRQEPGDTARAVHTYIMNADGTGQRRLFPQSPGTSTGAVWAPDGMHFLQTRMVDGGTADLFLVDTTGAVVRRLTDDAAYDGSPAFSPDGSRIAFYSERGDTSELVVMNADGTERRAVTTGGRDWYPCWSPDGRWLAYTSAPRGAAEGDIDVLAFALEPHAAPALLAGGPGREAEGRWRPRR